LVYAQRAVSKIEAKEIFMSEYISTKDSPESDRETIERLAATVTHLAWLLEDVLENGVAKKGRTNDSREAADQWLEDRWGAIKSARLEAEEAVGSAANSSDAARDFPRNTCAASRHAQMVAEAMSDGVHGEELREAGESILASVAALWKLRTETRAKA